MSDSIEILKHGSLLQHGKLNDRIYLMKLAKDDSSDIIQTLHKISSENKYSKIFCKIPKWAAPLFFSEGYVLEASIPKFFNKKEDAFFVSKFIDSKRQQTNENSKLATLSELLHQKDLTKAHAQNSASEFTVRKLNENDVPSIVEIYKQIFLSYPFPIHNPNYILQTMEEDVQYYGVEIEGKLAGIASSEIDKKGMNAEMTDFATSSEFQGRGLANLLLSSMEAEMKAQGISTLYTIARLNSIAMNKTFLRLNYHYSGTLINNTNIAGKIESMNVYYKHI
ncbi:MAG: putative beta-lysine N-acetyltransferase [Prolixibacteraceae bacterium]|jgi:putative beta-lysine N-acetyltransferase|nr:putative beta-lysine N-acetyltransferase [Prolixibacteraceae bacterium]